MTLVMATNALTACCRRDNYVCCKLDADKTVNSVGDCQNATLCRECVRNCGGVL